MLIEFYSLLGMLTFYSTLQTYLLWKCLSKEVCLKQGFENFYVLCSSDVVWDVIPVFGSSIAKAPVSKMTFSCLMQYPELCQLM